MSRTTIPKPAQVFATLFDYDAGAWTLQPISGIHPSMKEARNDAYLYHADFPDAKPLPLAKTCQK